MILRLGVSQQNSSARSCCFEAHSQQASLCTHSFYFVILQFISYGGCPRQKGPLRKAMVHQGSPVLLPFPTLPCKRTI